MPPPHHLVVTQGDTKGLNEKAASESAPTTIKEKKHGGERAKKEQSKRAKPVDPHNKKDKKRQQA